MDALPPLPPGAQELPPLPPGAEVVGASKADASQKIDQPPKKTVFGKIHDAITPFGKPPSAADYKPPETFLGTSKEGVPGIALGLGTGALQAPAGVAELLPNQLGGDYAAKFNKYLGTLGDPTARTVGNVAATLAPVGVVAKGADALKAALPLAKRAGSWLTGALTGGALGASEPTGKENYGERLKEKALHAAGGAALGAVPAVIPKVASGAKNASDFLTGRGYKTATEALEKDVLSKADSVIAKERGAGAEAESRGSAAEADAERNKKIAQQVLDEHAQRSTASKVETGEALQGAALQMREKYHDLRAKNSGYSDMAEKYRDQPIVDTKNIVGKIDETLRRSTDPGVTGFLSRIKTRIADNPKTTFDIADNFRKDLRDAIRTGQIKLDAGGTSSVGGETKALKDVHDALRKELAASAPEFEPVMKKFSDLSRPLDPFNKEGGALYGVVTKNGLSDEFKKNPGPVVDKIMKAVRDGDGVLGKLAAENPELKTKIRDHLNEQIFGSAANPKTPSAAAINSFNAKNTEVLDQLGLTAEFNGVRDARVAGEQAAEAATGAEKQVGELAKQKAASEAVAHEYDTLKTVLENAPAGEIYGKAETFATKMARDGHLTKEQHADLLGKIHDAEHRYGQTKSARRWLLGTLGAALTGYGVYSASGPGRFIHSLLPGGH